MVVMDLQTFISDGDRKAKLAAATNKSPGYLWQVATGWRGKRASPELAQEIERESALIGPEAVPKSSIRPDLWPADEQSPGVHRPGAAAAGGAAPASPDDMSEAA
jgi:hypothetical protein